MKKLIPAALLLILGACQSQPADEIRLTGSVKSLESNQILLQEGAKMDTILLGQEGTFEFTRTSTEPINGYLRIGEKYLPVYLVPGKDLVVEVSYPGWDSTLTFGGSLKPVADYMQAKSKVMRPWSMNFMAMILKEPVAYRASRDSLAGAMESVFTEYSAMKGFDPGFAAIEKLTLLFTRIMDMNQYSMMHTYYAKVDSVDLPDDWKSLENGLNLNDPLLVKVPAAMQYLTNYIAETAQKESGLAGEVWGKPEFLTAKFAVIKKMFTDPVTVETFLYNEVGQQIDANGIDGIQAQLEEYYGLAKNQEQVAEIRKKAAEWEAIQPGKPAPDMKLVDMAGTAYTLSQFKGKYIFIDFWATWCGPCKAEIPHLKKLYEDFKNKNIVIMSVSVDRDKAAWEKMVTEEGFQWLQLHDGTKENDKYVVRFIPTFVLIDREGNIINPRSPNPSDPKLREILGGLEL